VIVAVVGGEGGGTSTVAYALGAALDAVVVDAALDLSDLATARGPDLHDVLAGRAIPVEAVRESGPVALLPCGRPLTEARVPRDALHDALATVVDEYGAVVVDCPAARGRDTDRTLLAATACVAVTTPDPGAVADAVQSVALARALGAPVARVALNRAHDDPPRRAVERLLGAPAVAIPESRLLAVSMASGLPVTAVAPHEPAAEAITALAAGVHRSCRS